MSNNNSYSVGVIGITLLQIAFIILKLYNVIDWSWFWVLEPICISIELVFVVLIGYVIYLLLENIDNKRRLKSGMNKWAWKHRKKLNPPPEPEKPKSKLRT